MGATRKRSVHASDVLPDDLVRQIQQYVTATYVYVPAVDARVQCERVLEVLRLRSAGVSITEVARKVGVSTRRVCQIQKADRARHAAGDTRPNPNVE